MNATEKDLKILGCTAEEFEFGKKRYQEIKGKPLKAIWQLFGPMHPKNEYNPNGLKTEDEYGED